jgi:polysaccharide export outer membrane protein/exopolysaccharide production protein ExoF
VALRKQQADAVSRELTRVRDLLDRGLSNTARQLELERLVSDYQSNEVELETAVVRAQQEIVKARLTMTQLQDQRRSEIVLDLQQTLVQIDEYQEKLRTAQGLVAESEFSASTLDMAGQHQSIEPTFTIIRHSADGKSHEMPATQITLIEPGDIIKVELPVTSQPTLGPSPSTVPERIADRPPR